METKSSGKVGTPESRVLLGSMEGRIDEDKVFAHLIVLYPIYFVYQQLLLRMQHFILRH